MARKPKDTDKPSSEVNKTRGSKGSTGKTSTSESKASSTRTRPSGNVKHKAVTPVAERRTSGKISRGEIKRRVTKRVTADKPSLKGKALSTRITNQTAASAKRKADRGMTVTDNKKKKTK